MKRVELVAQIICEAKGIPTLLIPDTVKSIAPLIVRATVLGGGRVEGWFEEVSTAEVARLLRECREDKEGTLRTLAEWETEGLAAFAQIEQRQKNIAKKVLNAR